MVQLTKYTTKLSAMLGEEEKNDPKKISHKSKLKKSFSLYYLLFCETL